jgi:hypothetical protein
LRAEKAGSGNKYVLETTTGTGTRTTQK